MNFENETLELSHYTVKEFFLSEEDPLHSASPAREYLVNRQRDLNYIVHTCLSFLSLDGLGLDVLLPTFEDTCSDVDDESLEDTYSDVDDETNDDALTAFTADFPFYKYSAKCIFGHLQQYQHTDEEAGAFKRFFSVRDEDRLDHFHKFCAKRLLSVKRSIKPIQLAAFLLLAPTVKRLLLEGADPNETFGYAGTPLHWAIQHPFTHDFLQLESDFAQSETDDSKADTFPALEARRILTVESLITAGANVNAVALPLTEFFEISPLSPLCLAIAYQRPVVCKLLLEAGAKTSPECEGLGEKYQTIRDLLSEYHFFTNNPAMDEVLGMIQRQSSDPTTCYY